MIRALAPLFLLAGCATTTAPTGALNLPEQPPVPDITPLTLSDLRGARAVLIFPDISPETTVERLSEHLTRCRTGDGSRIAYDPNGMRLLGPAGQARLTLKLAQVSQSGAVSLDGPATSPELKEELAAAVQGNSRCAAT